MKKNTKKLLIGSSIAAGIAGIAGAAATSNSITKYLMKIALDRELPDSVKKMDQTKAKEYIAGCTDIEELMQECRMASEKLERREIETVHIKAHDDEDLVGHWYPCENAKRTIVAMHGWRSSWSMDFGMIADFWHDNGCNILFAEQRGQGESGGEYMGFGLLERYDCRDWVNWVNTVTELPIYLAGVSMGATTVLMASGLELPENVHGIMADCGFTTPDAIWKHVVQNNLHLSYGIRSAAVNDLCRKKISMTGKEYSAIDAMRDCKVPVMFVHGTDDTFVPIEMTYENYKACAAPKHLLVVPSAEHGMSYHTDKAAYEQMMIQFWNNYDIKQV